MIPPRRGRFNVGEGRGTPCWKFHIGMHRGLTDSALPVYNEALPPLWASAPGREAAEWQPQLFCGRLHIRTCVYIDGFNLYFRALRGTPFRWLDMGKLTQLLLPQHQILRIRYFTALITSRPRDPAQPQRQQTYIRALGTIPHLTIHYGHFLPKIKRRPLSRQPASGSRNVDILDTEEKGSDVNLASYLLMDGFENKYDMAVVISNDSDLSTPIEMTRTKLGKQVGVIDPSTNRSVKLRQVASWYRRLRKGPLRASLFPDTIEDAQGFITKPKGW